MKTIYRVVSGSRQYGTETEVSDFDYKEVFVESTKNILSSLKGFSQSQSQTIINASDTTFIEVGHFLNQIGKSNPNHIEVLFSKSYIQPDPFVEIRRNFFKSIFDPVKFRAACTGMALSNIKQFKESDKAKNILEACRSLCLCKHAIQNHEIVLNVKGFDEYEEILKPIINAKLEYTINPLGGTGVYGIIQNEKNRNLYLKQAEELLTFIDGMKLQSIDVDTDLLSKELYKIRIKDLIPDML